MHVMFEGSVESIVTLITLPLFFIYLTVCSVVSTSYPGTRTFDDQSMFPRGHGLQIPGTSEGTPPWIQNALRLFMMTPQPAPLVHYVQHCVDTLDVMAAPIRYSPQPMTFTLLREDVDFVCFAFTNQGGNVMVMTPGHADQCNNYLDYVQYYDGKPLEVGRMIAILLEQAEPPAQYAVVGLITDIKT